MLRCRMTDSADVAVCGIVLFNPSINSGESGSLSQCPVFRPFRGHVHRVRPGSLDGLFGSAAESADVAFCRHLRIVAQAVSVPHLPGKLRASSHVVREYRMPVSAEYTVYDLGRRILPSVEDWGLRHARLDASGQQILDRSGKLAPSALEIDGIALGDF